LFYSAKYVISANADFIKRNKCGSVPRMPDDALQILKAVLLPEFIPDGFISILHKKFDRKKEVCIWFLLMIIIIYLVPRIS
jgi:hypothetical protein